VDGGGYELLITTADPPPPGNDCSDPLTASLGDNNGDSSVHDNSYGIVGCNDAGSVDEVWAFTAPASTWYDVTVDTGGDFDVVLMLWTDCGSTTDFQCANPEPDSDTAALGFCAEADVTYYILVDTDDDGDAGGTYTLNITEGTVTAGDNCCDPHTAALGSNSGDTTTQSDSYGVVGCNEISGNDEVWEFYVETAGWYEVTVDTNGNFDVVVMVWPGDCGSASEWDCGNPEPDSDVASSLFYADAGATVYFLVDPDNDGDTGGAYDLTVATAADPEVQCTAEPTDCDDISTDPDEAYYGCCWNDMSYNCYDPWGPQPYGLYIEDCPSNGESCGYFASWDMMWCV
jgi:hypothetical protein